MQFTPVKECAMKHHIPVYQPKRVREPECIEELRKYEADIMVVVAFGQILPKEILEMTVVSDQFLSQIAVAINETSTGQDELLKAVDNINATMTKIVGLVMDMKTRAVKIDEISSKMESILKISK